MELKSTYPLAQRPGCGHRQFRAGVGLALVCGALLANFSAAHATTNETLFCDNFVRADHSGLAPWLTQSGECAISGAELCVEASSLYSYGHSYIVTNWTDYSVEAEVKYPEIAYGAGLGGRLDATTGAHYAVWVYPEHSIGKSNILRIVKFSNWGTWTLLQQVNLAAVGTNTHKLKLSFLGNQITAHFDGHEVAMVTDNTLTSGGITAEMWANGDPYIFHVDDVLVSLLPEPVSNVSAPQPSTIGVIERRADGNMHLVVAAAPGQVCHLQAMATLSDSNWSNILTNTANGLGVVEFDDLTATNQASRFYRIFTP